MTKEIPTCTSYAGSKIGNVPDEDIPRIVAIVKAYNETLRVPDQDMRWLQTMFVEKIRITHIDMDIKCTKCRMMTMNCFIGYVNYWKEIGKI